MTVKLGYPLRILLETTYYIGISPFKVGFNENGKPDIAFWLPQKVYHINLLICWSVRLFQTLLFCNTNVKAYKINV